MTAIWRRRSTSTTASPLLCFAGSGSPAGSYYEACTEQWVSPTRRADMQVIARDDKGAVVAQIWSGHKGGGGSFTTGQRDDYLVALDRELAALGRDSRSRSGCVGAEHEYEHA